MARTPKLLLLALTACLGLAGCYADQKKQLAACEASATRTGEGQPLRSIESCMDQAGYSFVGYANTDRPTVECDLPSVIRGNPSPTARPRCASSPRGRWRFASIASRCRCGTRLRSRFFRPRFQTPPENS